MLGRGARSLHESSKFGALKGHDHTQDPDVQAWLKRHGGSTDALFAHHHDKMEPIYKSLNRTIIMWQEAWNAPPRHLHAAAHILWKGPEEWDTWSPGLMKDERHVFALYREPNETLNRARIIYASSWYFDTTCRSWKDCYTRNPMDHSRHNLWGLLGMTFVVGLNPIKYYLRSQSILFSCDMGSRSGDLL